MSIKSTLECAGEVKPQPPSSQVGGTKDDQAEIIPDPESSGSHVGKNSRRAGPSKREIMEELSRQRFPWDE